MKTIQYLLLLAVASLSQWAASAVAAESSSDEQGQLRDVVIRQEQTIKGLEENQARQEREISDLKRRAAAMDTSSVEPPSFEGGRSEYLRSDASNLPDLHNTPSGMTVSVGAHINRAINFVDDGSNTETYFVGSGNYPTLIYLMGYKQASDDLTIGGRLELGTQHNPAFAVSQDAQNPGLITSTRYAELTFDSRRYGKLSTGRGFMSSFILVELDKSGTWPYNLLSPGNSFGGIKFVDKQSNNLSNIQINSAYTDLEAFSFRDRVRYDSPAWHGFQLSGSVGTAESSDVTLRYNTRIGDCSLFAGGSMQNNPIEGRIDDRLDGGVAILHEPTGLNATVAAAKQDYTRAFFSDFGRTEGDTDGWIVKLGLRRKWCALGESKVAVDLSRGNDVQFKGDKADSVGLFFGQMVDEFNMELYAGYRYYDYDTGSGSSVSPADVHGFALGARIGFDKTITAL